MNLHFYACPGGLRCHDGSGSESEFDSESESEYESGGEAL